MNTKPSSIGRSTDTVLKRRKDFHDALEAYAWKLLAEVYI